MLTQNSAKKLSLTWSRESLNNSVRNFLAASEQWKNSKQNKNAVNCLLEAGRLQMILGNKKEAELLFEKSLNISLKSGFLEEQIKLSSELSVMALESGEKSRSQTFLNKALVLSQNTKDDSAKASAFYSAAEFYYYKREISKAIDFYNQAILLWQNIGDRQNEAKGLLYLSYACLYNDQFALSLEILNKSLKIWQEIGDKRGEAFTYIAVGHIQTTIDEKEAALVSYKKAETLLPQDIDYIEKARLYNGFGSVYQNYQDWQTSINYRKKALEFFQKENHSHGQLATLSRLAYLYLFHDEKNLGIEYLNQARNLAVKLNDKFYLAVLQQDLANFKLKEGLDDEAIKLYRQALTYFENINEKRETADIFNKLGQIYYKKNNFSQAETFFLDSLSLNRRMVDKFGQAETLFNLAKLKIWKNDIEGGLNLSKESVDITELLSSNVFNSKLQSTYFSNVFDRYELYINLLMKIHRQKSNENYAVQALQAAEKSRARSMLEDLLLAEADFIKDASPEIVKREKEIRVLLNSKADKLTDLLSQNSDQAETAKLDREINELEHELEEIKATLKQSSPIYSAIKNPAPFDAGEFQRNVLDENSLLLEFSFGKEESYLWLVGKTEISSYVLPPREQIESRIEKLRKLIDSRGMLEGETVENYQAWIAAAETEFEREAQIFSRELLGQVADKLSNKRLIIVPDGKLHYFPIAALPFPNSTDNLSILLTNETIYEPSAATLALLMRSGRKISAAPKNLLVFSDPIFSNQDARIAAVGIKNEIQPEVSLLRADRFRFAESLTSLARLNASQDEADAIVEIIGESESTALNGATATRERALDASIADYKIIHFATHGLIDDERPELSGIVLSQVDETGQSRNGVVRLQDIYAMNLAADAVILSACGTGVGKEVKGEGLLSLNNAFLQTGAKSVVASLWKVDDYATRELMKNFYQELTSGTVTTAEALRQAQIKLRRNPQYQSPFYWAAFTAQGDFQNAPRLAAGSDYRIYGLLILPFALSAFYIYRRRFKLFNRKIINKN